MSFQSQIANRKSQIQLVIFDLGRVLIRICEDWRHACQVAGVTAPPPDPELDARIRPAVENAIALYDTGQIDLQTFAEQIAVQRGMSPQDIVAMHDIYLRGPYPGIDDLLADLSGAGLKTACLSNTSEHHWAQISDQANPNYLGLDRLTWRFASHLIGHMKPHAAIYEHVERETKLSPGSLLFFDDLDANVAAAKCRGWHAHVILHDGDPISQMRGHLKAAGLL